MVNHQFVIIRCELIVSMQGESSTVIDVVKRNDFIVTLYAPKTTTILMEKHAT